MSRDATIATLADGDCQRNEFLGLGVERTFGEHRCVNARERFDHLRDCMPKISRKGRQLVLDVGAMLVVRHCRLLI